MIELRVSLLLQSVARIICRNFAMNHNSNVTTALTTEKQPSLGLILKIKVTSHLSK